tara:strand:- start:584 stop:1630 length:1047 start_codon:yes stop_codon:yes gene_type:complete
MKLAAKPSIIEYLDRRLGKHSGRGPEFTWPCPVCIDRLGSESRKPKLHVHVDRGMGHCFRCDYGFRSLRSLFLTINDGTLRIEELRLLKRYTDRDPRGPRASVMEALRIDPKFGPERLRPVALPDDTVSLVEPRLRRTVRRALNYLEGRGVSIDLVRKHSIGYCPAGDYAGHLIFPVLQGGRQVYFTTRYAGSATGGLKSKNPPKRDGYHAKSTVLLNYDRCVGKRRVALVEGPFDMMAWDNAVALLGKTINHEQVVLLERLVASGLEELVISLDAEAGAEAIALHRMLSGRVPTVSVLFLDTGDPFDQRDRLRSLLPTRRQPTAVDQVRFGARRRAPVWAPTRKGSV